MKRIISLLLCFVIVTSTLLTMPISTAYAAATWKDTSEYVSVTKGLNIRSGPGASYGKITAIPAGYQVVRIGKSSDGWSKILLHGSIAYASSDYLKVAERKNSVDISGTAVSGYSFSRVCDWVQANGSVTVYKAPGSSSAMGTLTDKALRIGMTNNDWSQIIFNDKLAYVQSSTVTGTAKPAEPATPSTPAPSTPSQPSTPDKETAPTTPSGTQYKVTTGLNVRTGPSTSYKKLGVMTAGTIITSLGTSNGWHKFYYKNQIAWCSGGSLVKVAATSPVPSQPTPPKEETTPEVKPEVTGTEYYTTTGLNVRTGPSTAYKKVCTLVKGTKVTSLEVLSNGWHRIKHSGGTGYVCGAYLTKNGGSSTVVSGYPMTYKDATCTITVYKEWWNNAYVYAAHVQYTDYNRLWVECAKGKYNSGTETTSTAAKRVGAILAINGDYATPGNGASGYAIARKGVVCNDKKAYPEGVYNNKTGKLIYGQSKGISGQQLSDLVKSGLVTDTFQFGPCFLIDGVNKASASNTGRAQRTFIGTNGNAGDIWLCVSDGRSNDGKSAGLTAYECATYLMSKGCTLGVPLDGGGSSTMYFNGQVLNAAKSGQRAVADFVMFK